MISEKMLIRSKAPLRLSFSGGGTDVEPYSSEHGGIVLSSTINWYVHSSIEPRQDNRVFVKSYINRDELDVNTEIKDMVYDGKTDLVKATFKKMGLNNGVNLTVESPVPIGSGLGTSSAVVVSLAGAVSEFLKQPIGKYEISELAYDIERNEAGVKGGFQDQYAATFGGFNVIERNKRSGKITVSPLRLDQDLTDELHYHLLLCYTGSTRTTGDLISKQAEAYRLGQNIEQLHGLKELTGEMKNALLRSELDSFGELMDREWMLKREIAEGITSNHIDRLYQTAKENGAIGGKLCGAGGGGYLLLYCDENKKHDLVHVLTKENVVPAPFYFENDGLKTWRVRK